MAGCTSPEEPTAPSSTVASCSANPSASSTWTIAGTPVDGVEWRSTVTTSKSAGTSLATESSIPVGAVDKNSPGDDNVTGCQNSYRSVLRSFHEAHFDILWNVDGRKVENTTRRNLQSSIGN